MTDTTRKTLRPALKRPELDALIKQSVAAFNALSPEQQAAELRAQRISWVYGNLAIDNPNLTREQVEESLVQSGQIAPRREANREHMRRTADPKRAGDDG